ncbi:hypothetical protein JTE90_003292 [Oedothorax gibbosus]|uniref:Uncharacterized protein n=1 Tax=Oedothorax gibbosus TaxID=931172 RepID=A0AAV6V6D3_9ARAC|nr:hypothetical protein JTE90_003292 [Oedothorax gibbosus]
MADHKSPPTRRETLCPQFVVRYFYRLFREGRTDGLSVPSSGKEGRTPGKGSNQTKWQPQPQKTLKTNGSKEPLPFLVLPSSLLSSAFLVSSFFCFKIFMPRQALLDVKGS